MQKAPIETKTSLVRKAPDADKAASEIPLKRPRSCCVHGDAPCSTATTSTAARTNAISHTSESSNASFIDISSTSSSDSSSPNVSANNQLLQESEPTTDSNESEVNNSWSFGSDDEGTSNGFNDVSNSSLPSLVSGSSSPNSSESNDEYDSDSSSSSSSYSVVTLSDDSDSPQNASLVASTSVTRTIIIEKQRKYAICFQKFNRAFEEITALSERITECEIRYQRSVASNNQRFRLLIEQKLSVFVALKNLMYASAERYVDEMDQLSIDIEAAGFYMYDYENA